MECTCLAFYDNPDSLTNAYKEYWKRRLKANPRLMGYLLLQPDVHDVAWRSYKCFGFVTPEGPKDFMAFGIDNSHTRNHFHPTRRCPKPQALLVVGLSVTKTLDTLNKEGILALRSRQLAATQHKEKVHVDAKLVFSSADD